MDGQPSSHSNYSFYPNGEQQYAYAAAAATAAAAAQQPYSTLAGGVPTHMTHQPQLQTYSGAPVPRPHQPQIQHVSHLAISSDANKHRRSRSGCLTCRTRRVKCDELRPICERCQKGSRDCNYPAAGENSKAASRSKGKAAGIQETEDQEDDDDADSRETSQGAEAEALRKTQSASPTSTAKQARASDRRLSRAESSSSKTVAHVSPRNAVPPLSAANSFDSPDEHDERWDQIRTSQRFRSLDQDVQWYLNYHRSHITHHHYHLTHSSRNFVSYYLIEQSLTSDSLLYAIVTFTAYHYAVAMQDSRTAVYLGYYGKALNHLAQVIANRRKMRTQTLLTVLQLANFEEHVGDWVTLLMHQKAGYEILKGIWTLEHVVSDVVINRTLEWYLRFDLHAAFLAGRRNALSQDWYEAHWRGYLKQVDSYPDDLYIKCDERREGGEVLSESEFAHEVEELRQQFRVWTDNVNPDVVAPAINSITTSGDLQEMLAAINLHLTRGDEIGPLQFALCNFWSLDLMFKYRLAAGLRKPPETDTLILATKVLALFGVIMNGDATPGALLNVQAPLGIASLLIHDPQTIRWACVALVRVEQLGYIYPSTFRKRMADTWSVDVSDWWLPNGEGETPSIKATKQMTVNRDRIRSTAPRDRMDDGFSDDLKEMTGLFKILDMTLSPTLSNSSDSTH